MKMIFAKMVASFNFLSVRKARFRFEAKCVCAIDLSHWCECHNITSKKPTHTFNTLSVNLFYLYLNFVDQESWIAVFRLNRGTEVCKK